MDGLKPPGRLPAIFGKESGSMQVPQLHVPRSLFLQDKFWLLRKVSTLLKFVAWFVLGAGILVVAFLLAASVLHRDLKMAGQSAAIIVPLAGLFVYLLFASEWIQVMLDIEENTRHTHVVLRELLTRMYPNPVVPPVPPMEPYVQPPSFAAVPPVQGAPGGPQVPPAV